MSTEKKHLRISVLLGFVCFATLSRVALPAVLGHPSNFSPINAIALFSGAYFSARWMCYSIPILSVWIGDWFVNTMAFGQLEFFYPGFYWQYGTYILLAWMGSRLRSNITAVRVTSAALGASVLFFLISNFGVWAGGYLYPYTWPGLAACYVAGIPFFSHTLISDLLYAAVLFGGFELVKYRFPVLAGQKAAK